MRFYVGTYTGQGGLGILEVGWNGAACRRVVAETPNPSFMALHPAGHTLYAVNEVPEGAVTAFAIDALSGKLNFIGTAATGGAAPCHLAVHPTGRWLAVANYRGASVAVFALQPHGELAQRSSLVTHEGQSIHPVRQSQPHPHGVYWALGGNQLWVPDLGMDSILVYSFNALSGVLSPRRSRINLPPGCGPRHLAFHPDGNAVYCLNELDSTLITITGDFLTDKWNPQVAHTTLPAGFSGPNSAAEIVLHPQSHRLYCSNRGHDSVAIFDTFISPAAPQFLSNFATSGRTPRHFTVDSSGRYIAVANQDSHSVSLFAFQRYPPTGMVEVASLEVTAPACLIAAAS